MSLARVNFGRSMAIAMDPILLFVSLISRFTLIAAAVNKS